MNKDSLADLSYFLKISWQMVQEAGDVVASPEGLAILNSPAGFIHLGRLIVEVLNSGTGSSLLVMDIIPSGL